MFAVGPVGSLITQNEAATARNHLNGTRANLLHAIEGLSGEQWKYHPAENAWSIAEIFEHVVLVECRVHRIIARMPHSRQDDRPGDLPSLDEYVLTTVAERKSKRAAPEKVLPTGRWCCDELLEQFAECRERTLELLGSGASLRGHLIDHPMLGALDGYQWILVAAAHTARHTAQIWDVRNDPHFPLN